MARPTGTFTAATTSSGVRFQWNLDSYRSRGARDASQEQVEVLVSWSSADFFLRDAVGYTTWDNSSATLQRTVPLAHPLREGFWCDDYELTDYGAYESRDDFNDPENDNGPVQDWCIYTLTFIRPKWFVLTDDELAKNTPPGLETDRYTMTSDMPRPRERVVSGYGFEYLKPGGNPAVAGDWQVVNDERQFIPDHQIDLAISWIQIPIAAIPYNAIIPRLNTVNLDVIRFVTGARQWQPGELLFKGLAKPIEQYVGADDELYFDLAYRFTAQPGGWNSYLARDASGNKVYRPVRVRTVPAAVGAGTPPYPSSRFQRLFETAYGTGDLP